MFVQDKHLIDDLDNVTRSLGNVSKLVRELDRKLAENPSNGPHTPPIDRSLVSILGTLERANTVLVGLFRQAHGVSCSKKPFKKGPD